MGVRDRGLVVSHHSAGAGDRGVDRFCKAQECGGGDPFRVVVCAADPVLCVDGGREFGLVHAEWGLGSVGELRSGEWKVGRFERGKRKEEREGGTMFFVDRCCGRVYNLRIRFLPILLIRPGGFFGGFRL